jgi:hypothetical protein
MNSVAPLFEAGLVWYPETSWAEEVIEEMATFPFGEHDDHCLIGETLIEMADRSQKQIKDVCVGEYVSTPDGPRKVTFSGMTGVKPVFELHYGDSVLVGTGNHPVFANGGWKDLASLCVGDGLESKKQNLLLVKALKPVKTTSAVYNLTVEGSHCYYANGILTHNCDAATQALMRFRQGGFLSHPDDYETVREERVGKRVYY